MNNFRLKNFSVLMVCLIIPFFVCMIFSCLPTFNIEVCTNGVNFTFHALRIKGLWWSLENGVVPHHINDMANNFMGDADPIGYPYIFLYLPALLLKFLPYSYCYNIYIILINIATFMIMYISSREIYKDDICASISSVAWVLFYYRLYDIYDFCRMGEYTGLMWYPLAIAGLYHIFFDDRKKWWMLTMAMCGALGSHIITFFYLLLMVVMLSIVFFVSSLIIKKEISRIIDFIKAGVVSILLSLWFVVPFLEYYFEKTLNFSDMGEGGISSTTIDFMLPSGWQSVMMGAEQYSSTLLGPGDVPPNMSFSDYIFVKILIVLIISIAIVCIIRYVKAKDKNEMLKKDLDISHLILAILCFVIYLYYQKASTASFTFQTEGAEWIKELYGKQQFSFRELGRGGVFLSFSIGYILSKAGILLSSVTKRTKPLRYVTIYIVLIIMIISTRSYITSKLEGRRQLDTISDQSLSDYQFNNNIESSGIKDDVYSGDAILLSGEKTQYDTKKYHIDNYKRGYLSINFDYSIIDTSDTSKNENIKLKKYAYTGYNYYIDGKRYDHKRHSDGIPEVTLIGDKGHVNFRFENNIRWTMAFIISIVVFLYYMIKRLYKEIKTIKDYIKDERENHG